MNEKKIALLILVMTFICPLLIFEGTLDDFAPKHVIIINDLISNSYIPNDNYNIQVPAFYIFGAMLKLIANLSFDNLLFFPLQLIPYIVLFFLLIYKISDNYIFSALMTFIEMLTGQSGTPRVFLWVHGIGDILFFFSMIMILDIFKNFCSRRPANILMLIISGSALAFISYNLYAILLVFLVTLYTAFLICHILKLQRYFIPNLSKFKDMSAFVFNISLILIVVELGLSNFVYKTMILELEKAKSIQYSGIEKFLMSYLSHQDTTGISEFVLTFPTSITVISIMKYSIVLASILIFLFCVVTKVSKSEPNNHFDLILGTFLLSTGLYAMVRLYIGSDFITFTYTPSVFCLARLYQYSSEQKILTRLFHSTQSYKFSANCQRFTVFAVSSYLILVPSYEFILFHDNLVNEDLQDFGYMKNASAWYFEHTQNSSMFSDEMTKNIFLLNYYNKTNDYDNRGQYNSTQILLTNDLLFLCQKSAHTKDNTEKYYVLNYRLRALSLENWMIARSWIYSKYLVDGNIKTIKVYDTGSISVFHDT